MKSKEILQTIFFFEKETPPIIFCVVLLISLVLVSFAITVSLYLIFKHLKYYTQPEHQRYIVRIVFIIPIFGIYSLLSMTFYEQKVYFSLFRDCYESYALFNFFALCVQYGGGDNSLTSHYLSLKTISLPFPLSFIKFKPTASFLQICRVGILQYVFIKPILTIISIVLQPFGLYGEDEKLFNFTKFHDYSLIINNISVTTAMTMIVLFYQASIEELAPYKPFLKFVSIKVVIFLSFWQSVVLATLNFFNWIPSMYHYEPDHVANTINNFLICIEMLGVSFLHLYAFPYELYRVKSICTAPLVHEIQRGTLLKNVINSISQRDMLNETKTAIKGSSSLAIGKSQLMNNNFNHVNFDDLEPAFQMDAIEMGDFITYQKYDDGNNNNIDNGADEAIIVMDGASIVDSRGFGGHKFNEAAFFISPPHMEYISVDDFFALIERNHDELVNDHFLDDLDLDHHRPGQSNARR